MRSNLKFHVANIILVLCMLLSFAPSLSFANDDEIEKLNAQIDANRDKIEQLEKEIAKQRAALNSASGRANNLQSTINSLEATKKKLLNDVAKTEAEISRAELTIKRLDLEIIEKEHYIKKNSEGLSESIRRINEMEKISLIEKFLQFEQLSDFWIDYESTEKLQKKLRAEIDELEKTRAELKETQDTKLAEKNNLSKQKTILAGETEVVKSTQNEKAQLLKITKNEESEYQRILNQKLAEKKAFEEELLKIESKLNYLIDPNSFPKAGRGILGWPLDNIIVTQQFGGTSFAKNNPGIYGRAYHPGTDFGTPVGTQVKSVESGTVEGFENTDAFPGCRAWGKWVLIKHNNGLSSLYAHLSNVLVSQGQKVSRGEVIALSGNTGISTGPHLHLSVYASQGVRVGKYSDFGSGGGCSATNATGVFANLDAYYDPMSYLPKL